MSTVSTAIETRYTANIIDFEKQVARMASLNERASRRIEQQALKSSTAMKSAWEKNNFSAAIKTQANDLDSLSAAFTRLAPAIAAALTVKGGLGLIEHYTELSKSMKLAGISTEDFAKTQKQLGVIANDAGVPINALADLLRSVSQANGDLGLSQAQVIDLTKSVSLGLKVSGSSAEAASGALLQLGQALESGKVHAQEFNSINMAIHPLLVAAAQASEKYGGSVAKMKEDVDKGGLSSKEFARLLIAGQQALSAQTGKMATTQSQAMTKLQNALILYAGQVDQSLGISEKFAAIIELIAQNLDVLVAAVAIGATVIGARMVAAMAAYTVSTVASTAGTLAFAAAMKGIPISAAAAEVSLLGLKAAGSAVMGIFGGPIGLAITGVTLAIGAMIAVGEKEKAKLDELKAAADGYAKAHAEAADKADILKAEQSKSSAQIPDHLKKIAALTGEVDKLGNAYYDAAVKAKELILQQDKLAMDTAKSQYDANRKLLNESKLMDQAQSANRGAVYAPGVGMVATGKADPNYRSARTNDLAKQNNNLVTGYLDATKKYNDDAKAKLATFAGSDSKGTGKGTKTKGANETDKALKEAAQIQLAVALADAKTEEQRHQIRLQGLKDDLAREVAETEKNKNIKDEAKETLIQAKNAKYLSDVSEENKKYAEYQKAQAKAINDAENTILGKKQALATTAAEQHDLALKQLEYAHNEVLASIEANDAYDKATKARLKAIEQESYALDIQSEAKDFAQKEIDQRKDQLSILQQLSQYQTDSLDQEASLAKTRKERAELEARSLSVKQSIDLQLKRLELEELVQQKKITEQQADEALSAYQSVQKGDRYKNAKDNASPLDQYYNEIGNFDDAYSNIVVSSLKTIDDSISGLIDGTKSWGDVFHDVAVGVVADIARILLRQTLIKPIAKLLGAGDIEDKTSKWSLKAQDFETYSANSVKKTGVDTAATLITNAAQLGKMFGVPGFASGTSNFGGGLAITGENGPELLDLPSGTSVKNAAQTRSLLNPFKGNPTPKASAPTVHQYFSSTINADGVKTTEMFKGWIAQAAQQTAQQARDSAVSTIQKKNRNRF